MILIGTFRASKHSYRVCHRTKKSNKSFQLLFIPSATVSIIMSPYGLGKHIQCVPPPHIAIFGKLCFDSEFLLGFCTTLPRITIALLLIRVFAVSRGMKWLLSGYTTFMCIIVWAAVLFNIKCVAGPQGAVPTCMSSRLLHASMLTNGGLSKRYPLSYIVADAIHF